MPKLGAYSKEIVLARPDGRSKESRLLQQMRRELTAHLGGKLTAPQTALVERAAMLQLRIAVLDRKIIDGTFSEYDSKTYLAFSNSLTRTLAVLGLKAAKLSPTAALDEHIRRLASQSRSLPQSAASAPGSLTTAERVPAPPRSSEAVRAT